jgi:AcrR family transcriptional regulator
MAPRSYRMGKRAEAVARTRASIVDAAMDLYQEQPISATSMQEVARRADVSPGTVLNHFPSPEELAEAVVEELVRTLEVPTPAVFDGLPEGWARLRALARALAGFFERSEPWFHVHEREHRTVPAFGEGARRFDADVMALIREALGGAPEDRVVVLVRSLMGPPVFRYLRSHGGMSSEAAADLVTDVVVSWLNDQQAKGGRA